MRNDGGVAASLDLYLASKSPRRHQLLTQAGIRFAVCEPGAEYVAGQSEHASEAGDPVALAIDRARRKARGAQLGDAAVPILAVDTVVDLAGAELSKAADRDAAAVMLSRLAGREHQVHTAHCLFWSGGGGGLSIEVASAVVRCETPSPAQLQRYLDSEQWRGKAGAYGIQDPAQDFLRIVSGAFDRVVGLHLNAVLRLLRAARGQA